MKPVREGTKWGSADNKVFVVIHEVEADDGHKWVYYRDAVGNPPREYSCYADSFIQRFTPVASEVTR
jgi:hypothetical protein